VNDMNEDHIKYDHSLDDDFSMYDNLTYVANRDVINGDHVKMVSGNIYKGYGIHEEEKYIIRDQDEAFKRIQKEHTDIMEEDDADPEPSEETEKEPGVTDQQIESLLKDDAGPDQEDQ
jgi:hypothetical protein